MKKKRNYLLEAVLGLFRDEKKGAKVLDLGCGDGDYALGLAKMGFRVTAADLDEPRFRHGGEVIFQRCDVTKKLPFADGEFDHVIFLEIIEHLRNPYEVVKELARVLKPGGRLVLSTPNILSLRSRLRYLFEGVYDFFREPPLDQIKNPKEKVFNLHIVPYRYHELEFLLHEGGFGVRSVHTSVLEGRGLSVLLPIMNLQAAAKEGRSRRSGGIDFSRIHRVVHSKELLFGRHLIVNAAKTG